MKRSWSSPPKCGKLLLFHKRVLVCKSEHNTIDKVIKYWVCKRLSENIGNLICCWNMNKFYLFICDMCLDPFQVPLKVSHFCRVAGVLGPVYCCAIVLQDLDRNPVDLLQYYGV